MVAAAADDQAGAPRPWSEQLEKGGLSDREREKVAKLKEVFGVHDASGSGSLDFEAFCSLLKSVNRDYCDTQVKLLFAAADQDLSGQVDFDEFVDYVFARSDMWRLFRLDGEVEDGPRKSLMAMPQQLRHLASKRAKTEGLEWGSLSWRERYDKVLECQRELEEEKRGDPRERGALSPEQGRTPCPEVAPAEIGGSLDPPSAPEAEAERGCARPPREPSAERPAPPAPAAVDADPEAPPAGCRVALSPGKRARSCERSGGGAASADSTKPAQAARRGLSGEASSKEEEGGDEDEAPKMTHNDSTVISGLTSRSAMARMSQAELVDFSLHEQDISEWAHEDEEVVRQVLDLKEHLAAERAGLDGLEVKRFIAKGTSGWVFLAVDSETGEEVAVKLVRMTQAFSGIKEWYASRRLRAAGITRFVSTGEALRVVARSEAPDVVWEELKDAGPVPYYLCLVQELMRWGTLDDLAREGELCPGVMCRSLEGVAQTLVAMHADGLQHCDVKPENIMLEMDASHQFRLAKLCDFGSALIGESCEDDVRRFGITLFSAATGEPWTQNRLLHEKHENLVARLRDMVADCPDEAMRELPGVLEKILSCSLSMAEVAGLMSGLAGAYRKS